MTTRAFVPRALGACLILGACCAPLRVSAQDPAPRPLDRAQLLAAARQIMAAQTYCALVTLDGTGRPQVRTMNPFPPDDDMVVWFATNTRSLKVQQIRANPIVSLYYANHATATGYVAITGRAVLVEDRAEILKRKRDYWDTAFPGLKNLVLVKVVPERIEVLNYAAGTHADETTWRPPAVTFDAPGGSR